ncbi:MAG: hypothetical protein HC883_06185 [Bdellovibrionaceae bacterium]|nr:hypothetical protein [Pseudobdellovibrionaceae bacterium]
MRDQEWIPAGDFPPVRHPLAQSWDGKNPENYFVLDVRDKDHFSRSHWPNSHWVEVLPRAASFELKRPNKLVVDKKWRESLADKPVLVIGQDALDYRAYNLVSELASTDGLKVHYWHSGWDGLHGLSAQTPRTLTGVKVIGVYKAKALRNADAVFIDARDNYEAAKDDDFKGVVSWAVREGRDEKSLPKYRDSNLDANKILAFDMVPEIEKPPEKEKKSWYSAVASTIGVRQSSPRFLKAVATKRCIGCARESNL